MVEVVLTKPRPGVGGFPSPVSTSQELCDLGRSLHFFKSIPSSIKWKIAVNSIRFFLRLNECIPNQRTILQNGNG